MFKDTGTPINASDLHRHIVDAISEVYEEREARNIAHVLLADLLDIHRKDILLNTPVDTGMLEQLDLPRVIDRLRSHEPVQYITGKAYFLGLELEVNPDVLIPRPETEELVIWMAEQEKEQGLRVLDIGTGSGCIAIALAGKLQSAKVEGWDIDKNTLDTARRNAQKNQANVHFKRCDVLRAVVDKKRYDVIVSNPPYIARHERSYMLTNVLEYEPEKALFVDDDQPLLFYEGIATLALKSLVPGGRLYFEINARQKNAIVNMLEQKGAKDIHTRKDMQGKERMVACRM